MTLEDRIKKTGFPLEQWFDIGKIIPKTDRDICESQMLLYAVKENIDPEGEDAQAEIAKMQRAVRLHNKRFKEK